MNGTHALYRFYADNGRLLYVGITNNPGTRFDQHAADKPWWHEVRGITLETYPDRDAVLAAERRAIAVEQPLHNVQHRRSPVRSGPPTQERRIKSTELTWLCETCRKPVTGENGYIHVRRSEVDTVERAWQEWEARRVARLSEQERRFNALQGESLAEMLDLPGDAPWRVHHGKCDPYPDEDDYWFYVNRAKTHAHLLSWTGHFMETKSWIKYTDWDTFIRRVAGVPEA